MKCLISNSVLAAGLMLLSVASYGQTPITSVPYIITVPGSYILANNLIYSAANGNAIEVDADDVSIDLNRYFLWCPNSSNQATGIYAINKANVQIRNGAIRGFNYGVRVSGSDHLVEGIRFRQNYGAVMIEQSRACVVQNCQIIGPGYVGVNFANGAGNRAANNVANSLGFGFISSGTDYFDSNYADHCEEGFELFSPTTTATTKLRFNTTTNCSANVYGGTSEFANDN